MCVRIFMIDWELCEAAADSREHRDRMNGRHRR